MILNYTKSNKTVLFITNILFVFFLCSKKLVHKCRGRDWGRFLLFLVKYGDHLTLLGGLVRRKYFFQKYSSIFYIWLVKMFEKYFIRKINNLMEVGKRLHFKFIVSSLPIQFPNLCPLPILLPPPWTPTPHFILLSWCFKCSSSKNKVINIFIFQENMF